MNLRPIAYKTTALTTELHPYGTPCWIRTNDPRLRRPMLYPTELRVHTDIIIAFSYFVNGFSAKIEYFSVGETFEYSNTSSSFSMRSLKV